MDLQICRQALPAAAAYPCISFDYAQQDHLPSDPLQPGPLYFLVPKKLGLFGFCCEGLTRQMNFLIDEAHLISKGRMLSCPTCIISLSIMDSVRLMLTSTVTTVRARIRTDSYSAYVFTDL